MYWPGCGGVWAPRPTARLVPGTVIAGASYAAAGHGRLLAAPTRWLRIPPWCVGSTSVGADCMSSPEPGAFCSWPRRLRRLGTGGHKALPYSAKRTSSRFLTPCLPLRSRLMDCRRGGVYPRPGPGALCSGVRSGCGHPPYGVNAGGCGRRWCSAHGGLRADVGIGPYRNKNPQGFAGLGDFALNYQPYTASRKPAAMAEPMTPATLGPMACIRRKLAGLAFWPSF